MILTEEQGGFDLAAARDAVKMCNINITVWAHSCAKHLPGAIDLIELQTAEIERLRKALDESERVVAHKTKSAAHWYDEHLQARADLVQTRRIIYQRDAKIKELEDALSEYQRLGKTIAGRVPCLVPHGDCGRCSADAREVCGALEQIADGKIGPDANPRRCPHVEEGDYIRDPTTCSIVTIKDAEIGTSDHIVETDQMAPNGKHWQITEERKDVLRFLLSGEFSRDCECEYCRMVLETVRTMLVEVGQ